MSQPHEPGRRPAGSPTSPDALPPKTDADARPQEPRTIDPGLASEGGEDAPDPHGMMGEGGDADRRAPDTSDSSGMLNQGGERGGQTGGMLGEG